MTRIDLNGLEAARQLAALSPQTQHRFDEALSFGWTGSEEATQAFHAIGSAIASKRQPVSDTDKKKLFAFAERLLKQASPEVSNAVATCMVGQIWTATRESGFDFSLVDPLSRLGSPPLCDCPRRLPQDEDDWSNALAAMSALDPKQTLPTRSQNQLCS